MRIGNGYTQVNQTALESAKQAAGNGKAQGAQSAQQGESASSAPVEKVTVSAQAQALADKASADADTAKVQRLQGAIANGTFSIDAGKIAARIVDGG